MADPDLGSQQTYLAALEIRRVESSAGVDKSSVRLTKDGEGVDVLTFDIRTELMAEAQVTDMRATETVSFVYGVSGHFGEAAPHYVVCMRDDFPRNIGHLCAGPPGAPAVPCLALGGMQAIYERGGIEAILQRLRDFMRDAKTGSLMADGWEPVPYPVDQTFRQGYVEPKFFQEYAMAHAGDRSALGVALNFEQEKGGHTRIISEAIPLTDMSQALKIRDEQARGTKSNISIPWIFLWPDPASVEADPIFEAWGTGAQLRTGLDRLGLTNEFDLSIGRLLCNGCDTKNYIEPLGGKAVVLILGVWRPSPIMTGFFGYSADGGARRLELRAFLIRQNRKGSVADDDTNVSAIIGDYPPWPDLLNWVSGLEKAPRLSLIGMGALGSTIYNNYIRSGGDDVIVQDQDRVHPHNLSRHTATIDDIYKPKVDHAVELAADIGGDGSIKVQPINTNMLADSVEVLHERTKGRTIVDASADERVRLRIDELREASQDTIIRSEIFNDGRLGVTFVSIANGPKLSELMLVLISQAGTTPAVADWLAKEAAHPFGPSPMLYGFGCTSQTVHLANHVIAQHAAIPTSFLFENNQTSGIAINPLDRGFRPVGWQWIPSPSFTTLTPSGAELWKVNISDDVVKAIRARRLAALPAETGGYVYGVWDPGARLITIVYASDLPPGSVQTTSTLKLGPAGMTADEQRLTRKTQQRLYLCGSWHSHPGMSASMSGTDFMTMQAMHRVDAQALSPTLMLICAEAEFKAHLKV